MIYLGEKKAGTVYLGDKKLSKIYLGEKLVWEGYPEGHIIGTYLGMGSAGSFPVNDRSGTRRDVFFDSKGSIKADLDLTQNGLGGQVSTDSNLFNEDTSFATVISMKITLVQPNDYTKLYKLFYNCKATYVDVNSVKIILSAKAVNSRISANYFFYGCDDLKTIKAGYFPWGKINSLSNCFSHLSELELLDLSGADFSNVNFYSSFRYLGMVGTIVKVIGCSETTQNKILNALNGNYGEMWVLKDGVITKTAYG